MTTIEAKCLLVSDPDDGETPPLISVEGYYPRIIHAEFMTHRVFSRNSASSRAIPVEKIIQQVLDDPFVPAYWGANQPGMQAYRENLITNEHGEEVYRGVLVDGEARHPVAAWLNGRDKMVEIARAYAEAGYHKQIVNRLLEPWAHIRVVFTSTRWDNFFHLRNHHAAEPHIQMLARATRYAIDNAERYFLDRGDWHVPYLEADDWICRSKKEQIQISAARCASTSYKTVDGKIMTLEKALDLHEKLVGSDPLHASPMEHPARLSPQGGSMERRIGNDLNGNYDFGWHQYRKLIENDIHVLDNGDYGIAELVA